MEDYNKQIQEAISGLDWQMQPANLYQPIEYILSQGGKRIRPYLCLVANEMFGGNAQKAIIPAIAFEMLHNFTLIHDDIMDKADLRRGKPTVYKQWNTNIAILSGDALFAKAFEQMMSYQGTGKEQLLNLLLQTTLEICEGQQLDLDFETQQNVQIDEYIKMIRLKTAVMLAACLKAGVIVAQADTVQQQLLYDYGIQIGLAFQIQDDYLDVYADVNKFGKKVGGDIMDNKKTYMSLKAFELAQEEDYQQLQKYFSGLHFDKEEKFNNVKAIYDKYEVGKEALALVEELYINSISILDSVNIAEEKKSELLSFSKQLMYRQF